MGSVSEYSCIYSALITHDDEVTVTEDKLNALVNAAGVNVETFYPSLFGKALVNCDINSLICRVGAGGGGGCAAAATAAVPAAEERKEESEESDDDMCFGVFD
ncbi:large ribosomal subunit protein P1-like [Hemitrygon akajei]|uniref:large ribosomal subunit protein P1-like n=1 Tax=Hemitrygon akajei TaxID=2704970 RepID=UPI003BF99424